MKIISFGSKETKTFAVNGELKKGCKWIGIKKIVMRKIDLIVFAKSLEDLKAPPNNNLEKLKGDLQGFWSIRINKQFRVIFRVTDQGLEELKVTDYH